MAETIILLVAMATWGAYILLVERPREKRRQAEVLQGKGYRFLLDDEKRGASP